MGILKKQTMTTKLYVRGLVLNSVKTLTLSLNLWKTFLQEAKIIQEHCSLMTSLKTEVKAGEMGI